MTKEEPKQERMYSEEEDMINFHKWAYQKNRIEESDKTTKELLKEWVDRWSKLKPSPKRYRASLK